MENWPFQAQNRRGRRSSLNVAFCMTLVILLKIAVEVQSEYQWDGVSYNWYEPRESADGGYHLLRTRRDIDLSLIHI